MRKPAVIVLIVLSVFVLAVYLPMLYEKLFLTPIEKTHLLFSPVTQRFIYKEKIVGPIPPEAALKAEDHHARIAYRDADGTWYNRVEFEKHLPFIYYKNMELWGLLPLNLEGRKFDIQAIKNHRQVLELSPGEINNCHPETSLWPLLESNPGQARLVFPEDRFRMTASGMEFINADTNTVDMDLTERFTRALIDKGFVFPARSVNGKFTILKPFDEGVFLVDAKYEVFHVKRRDGHPEVTQTAIDSALKTRHIKISENQQRRYYGLLLAKDSGLHLLTYDNYRLVKLPLESYDPDRMDFKLLINPLYLTAVWSDETIIRAVTMDTDYRPLERYTHRMSRAIITPAKRIYDMIFPFSVHLNATGGGYLKLSIRPGGWISVVGLLVSLSGYVIACRLRHKRFPRVTGLCLIAAFGLYGLIAVSFIGSEC
ncbi:MAG: DUF4857 domain-containing protein [Desulfobacterales bacterium]|nr:DUF4857 domain-containing protein [Desulfobacterales bacterium]